MQSIPELLTFEYAQRRERNPNFSLRAFARWLEISPAQISQVMSGKRPVTMKLATKVTKRLGLSPGERNAYLKSVLPEFVEDKKTLTDLSEDAFHLISDWYHFAILSLAKTPKASADPRWISSRLGISIHEAREALDRLVRLGLLQTRPYFRQIGNPVKVASNVPSGAIRKFHKQSLGLATEKIDTVDNTLREIQAVTLSANVRKLPLAIKLINEAIDKIEAVLETGEQTEVYTLAVQLFPLTNVKGNKK